MMSIKTIVPKTFYSGSISNIWNEFILPIIVPLLLGLILAPVLAELIVGRVWLAALPVAFLVPAVILIFRYPFVGIIIWLAVLPLFPFSDEYKYLYYLLHRVLLPLTFGIAVLARMIRVKNYQPIRLKWFDGFILGYAALGIIWVLINRSQTIVLMFFYDRTLVPFIAYFFMRFLNPRERDLKRLTGVMVFLTLVEIVVGLIGWFAPHLLPSLWVSRLVGDRVVGTFSQSEVYGSILMYCLVFIYHYAMNIKKGFTQTFLVLLFGLGMVCIFFTFTRSCWGAALIVLLGLLFLYPKTTFLLISIVLPIMIVLGQSVLANEIAHATERLNNQDTAEGRVVLAYAGQQMFLAKPIFGWGYNQYDRYDWRFMRRVSNVAPTKWDIEKGTSHNSFLTMLAETGLVGFALYFIPVIGWLILSLKALPRLPKTGFWSWRLIIIAWLPIVFQLVTAQTVDYRFFLVPLTVMWLILGIIASITQRYLNSDKAAVVEPARLKSPIRASV